MKILLSFVFILISCFSFGQLLSTTSVDSLTNIIDKDKSLVAKQISLDTLHSAYGSTVKTEVTFDALIHPTTNTVYKIIWNNEGNYYCYVTIYYYQGSAVKGIVKAKYKQTDTNPEFEPNSVFYYQNDKVSKELELNGNDYRANGFWYLSTINDFITLARLKLK